MKKVFYSLVLFLLFGVLSLPAEALWEPDIAVTADSAYLVNLETGTIVWEKDGDKSVRPASMTKMMTVLLALESGANLDDIVVVPEELSEELARIKSEHGAALDCSVGDSFTVRNFIHSFGCLHC